MAHRKRKKLSPKATFVRKGVHFREVFSYVDVARVPRPMIARPKDTAIHGPFIACVQVGKATGHVSQSTACASGRNPRKAIAAALRKAATTTSKRSGAFAGLGRR